jgi:predicted O-methyltransferase YrrM
MNHEERLSVISSVLQDRPQIHPKAEGGVWAADADCYRFMAKVLPENARTLETGAGLSTILFAAWNCVHTCVVPGQAQEIAIRKYCNETGIDHSNLSFDLRPSDQALPEMVNDGPLDFVLIDGCHGFPLAIIDWFYAAQRLRSGGIVLVDDTHLPQVSTGLLAFLDADPRWEIAQEERKWRAYRRTDDGPLTEEWVDQGFLGDARITTWKGRVYRAIPTRLRQPIRSLTHKFK